MRERDGRKKRVRREERKNRNDEQREYDLNRELKKKKQTMTEKYKARTATAGIAKVKKRADRRRVVLYIGEYI